MKKNLIYGMITAVIAMILLAGGIMSMPQEETVPTENSGPVLTQPSSEDSSPATTPSTQQTIPTTVATQPTEPATQPTEPATQPTEPATQPTEPATQPTEPPVTEPAVPETTQPEDNNTTLKILSWPSTISGGETGTVKIQGKPNTTYTIKVYYKSGPSTAKSLADQISDADGYVTWTWKVSKNAKPGDFKIIVSGGGESVEVPFTVLD